MMDRLLVESCVGYFNSMNLLFKEYDKDMRKIRLKFFNCLQHKIQVNTRVHQMNLMNAMQLLYLNEFHYIPKKPRRPRSIWVKKRTSDWWDAMKTTEDDKIWIDTFRMDRETFYDLVKSLDVELKTKPNAIREALPSDTKIGAAIYKLATNQPYFNVGQKFGIHGISAQKAVYQFCEACNKILRKVHIAMPKGEEISDVMQQFEEKIALPQVLGVVESTQIPISAKAMGFVTHLKNKGTTELILQGIFDTNCLFRDVAVLLDGTDFMNYSSYIEQMMSNMPTKCINGTYIPAYLISRRTDAVQPWLMKPFTNVETPEHESFNDNLSESSSVAEQAFRKLKGRWIILREPLNLTVSFIPKVLITCCILHNIIEIAGIEDDIPLMDELTAEDLLYKVPLDFEEEYNREGEHIREHLKSYNTIQSMQFE